MGEQLRWALRNGYVIGADGRTVADVRYAANGGELIVKAVNSYEAMRRALEAIVAATDEDTRPYKGWHPLRKLADDMGIYNEDFEDAQRLIPVLARAALALAEEG